MHIKTIDIKGMEPWQRTVSLKLSALNVSVIYGENGCGKTVLLRVLNAVLEQNDSTLAEENVDSVQILYENDKREEKYIKVMRKASEASSPEEITYDWSKLQESELSGITGAFLCLNRGNASHINISPDFLYRYIVEMGHIDHFRTGNDAQRLCENLSEHIKLKQSGNGKVSFENQHDYSAPFLTIDTVDMHMMEKLLLERYHAAQQEAKERMKDTLFCILADGYNSADTGTLDSSVLKAVSMESKKKLIAIMNQMEKNALSDRIVSVLNSKDSDYIAKELKNNSLLARLIFTMLSELEREEENLQPVNQLKDIYNAYIGPDKYIELSKNGIVVRFHSSQEEHGIERLSGGEQRLFVLLVIFILEGGKRRLFLIDEPETSLSAKWQRGLVPLLSSLAPDAQIIVASHSPLIAESNVGYLVEIK